MIDFKARQMASKALSDAELAVDAEQKALELKQVQLRTLDPTGFSLPQNLTHNTTVYLNLSFDDLERMFSISPVGDDYSFYSNGTLYTKTSEETIQINNTDGLHFIYFDSNGTLKTSESVEFFNDGHSAIAYVYWNVAEQKSAIFALETHGSAMDWSTHLYNHESGGAKYINGLLAGNYTLIGDGSANSDAQLSISNGQIDDEDLRYFITHSATPSNFGEQKLSSIAEIPVMYRSGIGGVWTIDSATQYPLKQGTARIKYNLDTDGTWSTPDVDADDKYMAMWIFATNNKTPILAILGQRVDVNLEDAKANNTYSSLDFGNMPFVEFKSLWRLIFKTSSTYTNTPKALLSDVESLLNINAIQISAINTTDHNTLSSRNAIESHPSSAISFNNIASGYASENVQEIIDEVIDNKLEISGGQLTGIVKDASFIEFPNDGNPLISHLPTVAHTITHLWSSGKVHGFELTDNGDGTINLDSGDIFLRDLDTLAPLGNLKEYHIDQTANIALTDNSVNYVCANYNGGTPEVCVSTDLTQISGRMMIALYIVTRIGVQLYHYDIGSYSTDFDVKYAKKIVSQKNFEYGGNGAKITEVDNRKLSITSSAFYYINERLSTPSFDTSISDVFKYIYRGTSNTWNRVNNQTTLDNLKYDDGSGTLASIPSGKYVVNWVYLVLNTPTELYVKYPTAYHDTLAEAKVENVPLAVPPELQAYSTGVVIGKIIIQQGATNFTEIGDPFTQQFWTTSPTAHNDLAGLNVGDYQHLTPTQITNFDGKATKVLSATSGNFAGLNSSGDLTDSGHKNSDYVHVVGDESISGVKTFVSTPIVPVTAPILNTEVANKKYVDDGLSTKEPTLTKGNITGTNISITGGTGAIIGSGVTVSIPQSVAITANPTFSNITATGYRIESIGNIAVTSGTINNQIIPDNGIVVITSATANFTFTGFTGGVSGRMLTLINLTTNNMTIQNLNAGSTAINRVDTLAGNFNTSGKGSVQLIHNGTNWILVSSIS